MSYFNDCEDAFYEFAVQDQFTYLFTQSGDGWTAKKYTDLKEMLLDINKPFGVYKFGHNSTENGFVGDEEGLPQELKALFYQTGAYKELLKWFRENFESSEIEDSETCYLCKKIWEIDIWSASSGAHYRHPVYGHRFICEGCIENEIKDDWEKLY